MLSKSGGIAPGGIRLKKSMLTFGMGAAALLVSAWALAQGSGSDLLKGFATALNKADSVKVTYTMQTIGGSPDSYTVRLAKPNMAWIDTPTSTTVADGSTITVFSKKENNFYKKQQTPAEFKALFSEESMTLLAPFFNDKNFDGVAGSTTKGVKNRKGAQYKVVEVKVDKNSNDTTVFYLDPADNIAKQAELNVTRGANAITMLIDTKAFEIGGAQDAKMFAFKAPSGATEVSEADLMSDRWYTDLDEAKSVAAKTGRKIFVDFFATWCGPCKKLEAEVFHTEEFKKLSKSFVFLRIDVDAQKSVASAYSIEAMPTQMVLDKEGAVLGKTVGYGSPEGFYAFIKPFAN